MKSSLFRLPWRTLVLSVALLRAGNDVAAFPPAPNHIVYGFVRDEWGTPLSVVGAEVFISVTDGAPVRTSISKNLDPGMNYQMSVPMDSGIKPDVYKAGALTVGQQFRLKIKIGQTTYIPIEMTGVLARIGIPGQATRLDLTLGVDSDGDGIPDAWENAIIATYGGTLAGVTANGDADGDGISNRDEFLAGTLAFDPSDGFRLGLDGLANDRASLSFLTTPGRTYSIRTSTDLQQWTPASFRVVTGGVAGPLQDNYASSDIRQLQIEVPFQAGLATNRYFKAFVQ